MSSPKAQLEKLPRSLQVILILGAIALAAFPLVPVAGADFYLQMLSQMMILAIFAMSLDLLQGVTGLVSLGHAAYFGLAGYALAFLTPADTPISLWWSLPVSALGAGLAALIVGTQPMIWPACLAAATLRRSSEKSAARGSVSASAGIIRADDTSPAIKCVRRSIGPPKTKPIFKMKFRPPLVGWAIISTRCARNAGPGQFPYWQMALDKAAVRPQASASPPSRHTSCSQREWHCHQSCRPGDAPSQYRHCP